MELSSSIKKTIKVIKNNKFKLFTIFFLQIIFFIALAMISQQTIVPSMQHAKDAMDYYDSINMTQEPSMFGYLGEDPLVIYQNYDKMLYYIKFMGLYSIVAFIIINGLIWALTHNLISRKSKKQFITYLLNFTIIILTFVLINYTFIFSKLKTSLIMAEANGLLPFIGNLFLFIILLYFLYTALSLIDKRKIKDIVILTFKTGILKFPYIILTYIINLIIISLFAYLIYLTIESNIILLSITTILFILSFIITRLFLIITINNLKN